MFESNIFSVYSYLNINLDYTCLNIPIYRNMSGYIIFGFVNTLE